MPYCTCCAEFCRGKYIFQAISLQDKWKIILKHLLGTPVFLHFSFNQKQKSFSMFFSRVSIYNRSRNILWYRNPGSIFIKWKYKWPNNISGSTFYCLLKKLVIRLATKQRKSDETGGKGEIWEKWDVSFK